MTPRQRLIQTTIEQIDLWNVAHSIEEAIWNHQDISIQIGIAQSKLAEDDLVFSIAQEYFEGLSEPAFQMLIIDILKGLKTQEIVRLARRNHVFKRESAFDEAKRQHDNVYQMLGCRFDVLPTTKEVDGAFCPAWQIEAVVTKDELEMYL